VLRVQRNSRIVWKSVELHLPFYSFYYAIDDDLNLAIAHAWLIDDAGEVVDPTWSEGSTGATYFGVVFDSEYVLEVGEKDERYGILENDYMNGHKLMMGGLPPNALHSKFHPKYAK
jgi:hypothetical protein